MFDRIQVKNRTLNFSKTPEKYDEYVCTLSPEYQEIAERELNETEETRTQCLKEMREWIADNPKIISCRTDAIFLLRFLRVSKFNVERACKKLMTYLYTHNHEKYSKWYKDVNIDDENVRSLHEDGYITVLPEKDSKGRQILLFRTKCLDPLKFTSNDLMRMAELFLQMLSEDEEVQVSGIVLLFDDRELCLKHITMWSLNEIREAMQYFTNVSTLRAKGNHRIFLPGMARALFYFIVKLAPAKIQKRFQVCKTMDDVKSIINLDILPKEYNEDAKYSCKEIMTEFVKVARARKDEILLEQKMTKIEKRTPKSDLD